jgi:hypothetical protein
VCVERERRRYWAAAWICVNVNEHGRGPVANYMQMLDFISIKFIFILCPLFFIKNENLISNPLTRLNFSLSLIYSPVLARSRSHSPRYETCVISMRINENVFYNLLYSRRRVRWCVCAIRLKPFSTTSRFRLKLEFFHSRSCEKFAPLEKVSC